MSRPVSRDCFMEMSYMMNQLQDVADSSHMLPQNETNPGIPASAYPSSNFDQNWMDDAPMPPDEYGFAPGPSSVQANISYPESSMNTPLQVKTEYEELKPMPSSVYSSSMGYANRTTPSQIEDPKPFTGKMEMETDSSAQNVDPSSSATNLHVSGVRNTMTIRPQVMHVFPVGEQDTGILQEQPSMEIEREHWCQIRYYEFNQRVGQPWHCNDKVVHVDGLCSTADVDRLSIGSIGNGSREAGVVNVRGQIGKGISFTFEDGCCYLTCLGNSPVFVQCPMQASLLNDEPSTAYRLSGNVGNVSEQSRRMQVFNEEHLTKLITDAQRKGYKALYALQKMCTVRISFVKGFGKSYRRQTIMETPVWIEVFFIKHMQMIDKLLQEARYTMDEQVSSFS